VGRSKEYDHLGRMRVEVRVGDSAGGSASAVLSFFGLFGL